jgi:hypothetical protein
MEKKEEEKEGEEGMENFETIISKVIRASRRCSFGSKREISVSIGPTSFSRKRTLNTVSQRRW